MGQKMAMVDYLVLDEDTPYLRANACEGCGALYFDRRNACAKCGKQAFSAKRLSDEGKVVAFTIVQRAAPGVPTPYVSSVIELDGGGVVKANLVNVDPNPEKIELGMPVKMTTFTAGSDGAGNEAIAFGYVPA